MTARTARTRTGLLFAATLAILLTAFAACGGGEPRLNQHLENDTVIAAQDGQPYIAVKLKQPSTEEITTAAAEMLHQGYILAATYVNEFNRTVLIFLLTDQPHGPQE